ncbi:MAG: hypothetical protein K0R58_1924 [Ramlibacter sp.]|jgi:hypothetical protein|nr:hypothetical protein [Ramlibacter sp.]
MRFRKTLAVIVATLVASCGGGDDVAGASAGTRDAEGFRVRMQAETLEPGRTQIILSSDVGDYVGGGDTFSYTQVNAAIAVEARDGDLRIRIYGDQIWEGRFALPEPRRIFIRGSYRELEGYYTRPPSAGGLQWTGDGRGCGSVLGSIRINSSEYVGPKLVALDMDFVQHCHGQEPALHGNIRWYASDDSHPPGPVRPVPSSLWSPPADAVPATGSFVYLESDAGDPVGQGVTRLYTSPSSQMNVDAMRGVISVHVNGDQPWSGHFETMGWLSRVFPGFYGELGIPIYPAKGGLRWIGGPTSCNQIWGWFVVDDVSYVDGKLARLDMRFAQHCEAGAPALRGRIRWDRRDAPQTEPMLKAPDRLWKPPTEALPAQGNYAYLESPPGDEIGGGVDAVYAGYVDVLKTERGLLVYADGWYGTFEVMSFLERAERGFYPNARKVPFQVPGYPGMSWSRLGAPCGRLVGWFVIDHISYTPTGVVRALDMRFFQRCEGTQPPLRGAVHWVRPS